MSAYLVRLLSSRRSELVLLCTIVATCLAVYGSSLFNDFVRFDDGLLITENPVIREISPASLAWIFTHYDPELYIPLTFLSYQIDYSIGGTNPFVYHLTSLLLHSFNAFLVFLVTFRLSRKQWVGVFCGLLFAVHPLHTEAIAWASGRKDVLSALFFLLSIVFYESWLRRGSLRGSGVHPATRDYWISIGAFFLGLLSKVSIIVLPFILILIDYYRERGMNRNTLREKIPYFLLSFIFGIVALYGKRAGLAGASEFQTLLMAARSTMFYIQKLLVPVQLSVLYPTEREILLWYPEYFVPMLIVFAVGFSLYLLRRNRTLPFGVLFYVFMIAPSFPNFAKDGEFFFASDRYAYLGSIGIFFLVCSLLFRREEERGHFTIQLNSIRMKRLLPQVLALSFITLSFGFLAYKQSFVWRDSESLFAHAQELYPASNARAYNNLGNVYRRQGKTEEAIAMFKEAIAISPSPRAYSNLGALYRKERRILEALESYGKAIDLNPDDPEPYFGLGLVYAQAGDGAKAMENYARAIELDPLYAEAYSNMGSLLYSLGDSARAIEMFTKAIESDSLFMQAYFNLGVALAESGQPQEAIRAYKAAITLFPDAIAARINLGILLYEQGEIDAARLQFKEILKRDPQNAAARKALMQIGE